MDILFFLKERTEFIQYFYEATEKPFIETMQKIDAGEPPFHKPPYSEDGEPAFLVEWQQAEEGLEVLGRTCLSMLSSSLHLYLKAWEEELRVCLKKDEQRRFFKRGWVSGYKKLFEKVADLSWDKCPADLDLIEQISLGRNRDQHPEQISSMRVHHADKDLKKYPHPFFMSEIEGVLFPNPSVHVSRDALFASIEEIEKLAVWMEGHLLAVK